MRPAIRWGIMIRLFLVSTAFFVGFSNLHVHAAGFLEKNFYLRGQGYTGELPACQAALPRITNEFAYTQEQFWALTPVILGYERVREIAYGPWPLGSIPHRYCEGTAVVQDPRYPDRPRKHKVHYRIGEDTGFASVGWGVEWCVTGYDWNWAYNPACEQAEP
jgi:hypothetical protein